MEKIEDGHDPEEEAREEALAQALRKLIKCIQRHIKRSEPLRKWHVAFDSKAVHCRSPILIDDPNQKTIGDFASKKTNPKPRARKKPNSVTTTKPPASPTPTKKKVISFDCNIIVTKYPFACRCGCGKRFDEETIAWWERAHYSDGSSKTWTENIIHWEKRGYPWPNLFEVVWLA